jgi:hypothetical protein
MRRPILIYPLPHYLAAVYAGDDEVDDNVCVNCVNYLYRIKIKRKNLIQSELEIGKIGNIEKKRERERELGI